MNKQKLILLGVGGFLLIIILSGSFYWFQWRPTEIKKSCSMIKMHKDAVPEVTADEANKTNLKCNNSAIDALINLRMLCNIKPSPAQPAKDWTVPATDKEYTSCLRQKGL
jgi:hypothetical protein